MAAALVFALTAGGVIFVATGVSIFIVRQIPAGVAFKVAGRVEIVYVAAAFAGLGGAAFGLKRSSGRGWPIAIALLVAASGILDVASAITPAIDSRLHLVENVMPNVVPKVATALVVPAGLALLVLARGLWRRQHRAWQLTLALVVAAAVLHLLKGFDYEEAAVNVLIGLALVARRHDFAGRGDPSVRTHLLLRTLAYTGAIVVYAFVALWVNRVAADQPYTLAFAAKETGESLIGSELVGTRHLGLEFGKWFPLSVLLLGATAALSLLWTWLAPWRYRLSQDARDRAHAERLVRTFGVDTLAPFSLRGDKSYFFGDDERAFLAYKVVAGVAVVSGDPIGPDDAIASLIERFLRFAHERDWRVADPRRRRPSPAYLPRSRAACDVPRRRGGRTSAGVLTRRPSDQEGTPVGDAARAGGLPRRDTPGRRDPRRAPGRTRRHLRRVAGRRTRKGLHDGARYALPAGR